MNVNPLHQMKMFEREPIKYEINYQRDVTRRVLRKLLLRGSMK